MQNGEKMRLREMATTNCDEKWKRYMAAIHGDEKCNDK